MALNNDRGYEPGNVRWATSAQQQSNKRRSGKLSQRDKWTSRRREMRSSEASYQAIADEVGFSIGVVWKWLQC